MPPPRVPYEPRASVAEPRAHLLASVLEFVRAASTVQGVLRIALIGSLTTIKPMPKDADLLVTIERAMELAPLARIGRRIQGQAQSINCGADIFLADQASQYLGRICHYRECRPRMACRAIHCGLREHLNDDLHVVTLSPTLIGAPPIELWPQIITRAAVPGDVQAHVLSELATEMSRDPPPASG